MSELQVIRDWLCVRDIAETSLSRLLLFLILKSSHRRCSVEKSVLEGFTGKYLCCSLFLKNFQTGEPVTQAFFQKTFISKNDCIFMQLYLLHLHEKETANEAWVEPSQTYLIEIWAKAVKLLALKGTLMQIWKSANIFVFVWK